MKDLPMKIIPDMLNPEGYAFESIDKISDFKKYLELHHKDIEFCTIDPDSIRMVHKVFDSHKGKKEVFIQALSNTDRKFKYASHTDGGVLLIDRNQLQLDLS